MNKSRLRDTVRISSPCLGEWRWGWDIYHFFQVCRTVFSKFPCCLQPSQLGQSVFDFSLFFMFLCREMGSPPSGEGQWLDIEFQGKQEAHTKQPASRRLVCWPWPWSSSPHPLEWAVPHLRWSVQWHFQVDVCCHLDDQQENCRLGSQRHTDKKWWIRNILYSHKVFVACVLWACAHFSTYAITLQVELFVQRARAKLNTSSDMF